VVSRSRTLVRGTTWILAASVIVTLVQLPYAAATSRLVAPQDFGSYGAALSGIALIGLITANSFGPLSARELDPSPQIFRQLLGSTLILGVIASLIAIVIAGPWERLWSAPGTASTMRWASMILFILPAQKLLVGEARRSGRIKLLSSSTALSGFAGILLGILAVYHWRSSPALIALTTTQSWVQVIILLVMLKVPWIPRLPSSEMMPRLRFARSVTGVSLVQYGMITTGPLTIGRAISEAALGQFNRAATFAVLPLATLQTAIHDVLYPEFRHDIHDTDRSWGLWPKLIALAAWLALPAGLAGGIALRALIPVVLGPQWVEAASMAVPLAIGAAISIPASLLSVGLEATGKFKQVAAGLVPSLATIGIGCILTIRSGSFLPMLWAIALQPGVNHLTQIVLAGRAGISDSRATFLGYIGPLIATVVLGAWTAAIMNRLLAADVLAVIGLVVVSALISAVLFLQRERIPAFRIAKDLGLLKLRES
jgi:O-antigen/teichoic acid export membrane protein